jgi:hypothetical protein
MNRCRLVQLLNSLTSGGTIARPPTGRDDGKAIVDQQEGWLARRLRAHRASCETCRRSIHLAETLGRRLTAAAARARGPVPPFLAARIVTRIVPAPSTSPRVAWKWAGALAGTAALMVGVFWMWTAPQTASSLPASAEMQPSLERALASADLPMPDAGRLLAYSQGLDRAFEREWHLVMADARKVAASLAAEFLPQSAGVNEGRRL